MATKDRIETPQLVLVRATLPMLEAEQAYLEASQRWHEQIQGLPVSEWPKADKQIALRDRFQALLGVDRLAEATWRMPNLEASAPWPEPADDFDSRDLTMIYLKSSPEWRWGMWYLLLKSHVSAYAKSLCIGTCGFKSPPSADGSVEIGYWFVDRYQAVDLAAEMVGALVAHAFEDSRVRCVAAETSARHVPTIRVLGKNSFRRVGPGKASGSLLFRRDREIAP